MDYHKELITVSQKLIPDFEITQEHSLSKKSFIDKLSPYINHLLDNDFQKLVQIMYRIDVSEKEFALTLQPGTKKIPEKLAEMVYDRLCLKAKIRAEYKAK
ncbi:hypothetical protein SAMN05661096_01653 [Marivirga sericea]|uniref:Uncharacterized protein n=1 Tax=Marivirga sericea TaxID=1028 RepID=A0A1X7JIZ7_9BACT|nr:hypothetical protein [Marivirga sericea]SMG27712.1 hypothetical protein SAMN05661096_01653 [Marivirga sericea]